MHISILLMEQIVELFIEIALDGIKNEELRDPKKCYQYINIADTKQAVQNFLKSWHKLYFV